MFVLLEFRPKNLTSPTWSHHAIQPQNASHVSLPRPSTNLFLFFCPPVVLHRLVNAYYYFTQHPPLFFDFFSVTVSYTCTSGPNFQVSFVPTQLSLRRVRMPCCYLGLQKGVFCGRGSCVCSSRPQTQAGKDANFSSAWKYDHSMGNDLYVISYNHYLLPTFKKMEGVTCCAFILMKDYLWLLSSESSLEHPLLTLLHQNVFYFPNIAHGSSFVLPLQLEDDLPCLLCSKKAVFH